MIVADTNLIVYFHVDGQWTSQAEQVATIDPVEVMGNDKPVAHPTATL